MYQEFHATTQLFTLQSVVNPTQQGVIAHAPWFVQLWLVNVNCGFYYLAPSTSDISTSVHVPPNESTTSIAMLRYFSSDATALLINLIEARPFIRTELNVKTPNSGQLIFGLVDGAPTLDFMLEYFAGRFFADLQD
jgi:hypothetical protein